MMLAGKVVAVTGAGRGIGRAVALLAAREGAAVVVNDPGVGRDGSGGDEGPSQAVVAEITGLGGRACANGANVADPAAAATVVGDAVTRFGRIDAVAHCAGILRDAIWHRLSLEDWRAVIDVHLDGAFHLAKAATPHLREQESGSFVFFTSGAGLVGNVGQANYAAAKLGVVGLSQSIALDMMRYGVRANCIAPIAWTRMMAGVPGAGSGEAGDDPGTRALRALGPDRVAPLAVYLMADASRGVTNQIFGVCGDEISLFSKPRPVARVVADGPWTAQTIAEQAMAALGPHLARADETATDLFRAGEAVDQASAR